MQKDSSVYDGPDLYANVSNLWAVGWSEVPLQLLVLLQMNKALCLGLLILDVLGDRLQFLWVQLGIQGTHLPHRAADQSELATRELWTFIRRRCTGLWIGCQHCCHIGQGRTDQ